MFPLKTTTKAYVFAAMDGFSETEETNDDPFADKLGYVIIDYVLFDDYYYFYFQDGILVGHHYSEW